MLRMTLLLIAFCVQLSGCGSARTPTTDVKSQVAADLGQAAARTVGAHTATFRLMVAAGFHGAVVRTESGGSVSFVAHQAHVYKVVPGDPVPEEEIIDGHLVYANSNITAALADPAQKGWTRLDTRRITSDRRLSELDHVRTAVYLAGGAADVRRLGVQGGLVHFRARVVPARVLAHVPAARRSSVRTILGADYTAASFPADFWLDGRSRLRRVRVSYRTDTGTTFTLVATFSAFGAPVDVTPPSAAHTQDITP